MKKRKKKTKIRQFVADSLSLPRFSTTNAENYDIMNKNTRGEKPFDFLITNLPDDFAEARLQEKVLLFDNLNRKFPYPSENGRYEFPVKCGSYIIIMIQQGHLKLKVNLQELAVHKGQFLMMSPGCIFKHLVVSQNCRYTGIVFDQDFVASIYKSLGMQIHLTDRYNHYTVQALSDEVFEHNLQMYKLVSQEIREPDHAYKAHIVQRYCEIWFLKNQAIDANLREPAEIKKQLKRKELIFHDFLTLLEANYKHERSIGFYAERLCLTPKYLSTTIKEVSGKLGLQWIDEYVALEAQALLRDSTMSVKQVSEELNFPSQSMFGRFFKKMTGYTPKQYKYL